MEKLMSNPEFKNIIEALIFASEDEISLKQIKDILDSENVKITLKEIEEITDEIKEDFLQNGRAFELINLSGGFRFATKKNYSRFVGRLFEDRQRKKLSQSALETLSIIAYKQPITRSEIEFIRGVNVDYIVNSLLERELITIIGRAESPGRPIIYGTTKNFLKLLGLNSIEDLPKLKEINEILKNEKIEGITEADIELFNSVYNENAGREDKEGPKDHQLELLTSEAEPEESDTDVNTGTIPGDNSDVTNIEETDRASEFRSGENVEK
jgi:segregation and condensation protein B